MRMRRGGRREGRAVEKWIKEGGERVGQHAGAVEEDARGGGRGQPVAGTEEEHARKRRRRTKFFLKKIVPVSERGRDSRGGQPSSVSESVTEHKRPKPGLLRAHTLVNDRTTTELIWASASHADGKCRGTLLRHNLKVRCKAPHLVNPAFLFQHAQPFKALCSSTVVGCVRAASREKFKRVEIHFFHTNHLHFLHTQPTACDLGCCLPGT